MDDFLADVMSQYTPKVMLEAMIQEQAPTTFLRDQVVRGRELFQNSDIVEWDQVIGGAEIAVYVDRTGDPNLVEKRSFSSFIHAVPFLYEAIPFSSEDVKKRMPGQSVYAASDMRAPLLDRRMGEWQAELDARFIRLEEKQIADAMQTGVMVIEGKGVKYTIDFGMKATHKPTNTGGQVWGGGGNILQQLKADARLIRDSGANPARTLILGATAAQLFLDDAELKEIRDNRRDERIAPIRIEEVTAQNASYLTTLREDGLQVDVYSYEGYYRVNGVQSRYIDDKNSVLFGPDNQFQFLYGMQENLGANFQEIRRYPSVAIEPMRKRTGEVSLESAPMFLMKQPDGVVTRKVVE